MPSFFVLLQRIEEGDISNVVVAFLFFSLQHNNKGDSNVVVITFFFPCSITKKVTITLLSSPFSFCCFLFLLQQSEEGNITVTFFFSCNITKQVTAATSPSLLCSFSFFYCNIMKKVMATMLPSPFFFVCL